MAFAELLLATTGILSTSIGAGVYLTGATHDIERDEPLKELPTLGEVLLWWVPKISLAKPYPKPLYAHTANQRLELQRIVRERTKAERERAKAARGLQGLYQDVHKAKLLRDAAHKAQNTRAPIGPEARNTYEDRRQGTSMVGKYLVGREALNLDQDWPSATKIAARGWDGAAEGLRAGEWYGHLRGIPLEQIVYKLTGEDPSRVYEAKVYEDKHRQGHVLTWLPLGEREYKQLFISPHMLSALSPEKLR